MGDLFARVLVIGIAAVIFHDIFRWQHTWVLARWVFPQWIRGQPADTQLLYRIVMGMFAGLILVAGLFGTVVH